MLSKLITVFTPTYNRKDTLKECYESLLKQRNKNFRWQIIDDGSTDGTEKLVDEWIGEKLIDIDYIKKRNGGKASAINFSLNNCDTLLWFCLDSDDYLFSDAIDIIVDNYKRIENNDDLCGMFGLRSNPDGSPMQNKKIPNDTKYTTQNYVRYDLKIPPEYYHVFKTEIIKKYPYPLIKGERYIPLSFIFDQLDTKYKYLVIQDPVMVCEYQRDGITKNKRNLIKKNPKGYALYKKQLVELAPNLSTRIKSCITYNTACLLSKENPLKVSSYKALVAICFPLGVIDYLIRYRFKININIEAINKVKN